MLVVANWSRARSRFVTPRALPYAYAPAPYRVPGAVPWTDPATHETPQQGRLARSRTAPERSVLVVGAPGERDRGVRVLLRAVRQVLGRDLFHDRLSGELVGGVTQHRRLGGLLHGILVQCIRRRRLRDRVLGRLGGRVLHLVAHPGSSSVAGPRSLPRATRRRESSRGLVHPILGG